MSGDGPIDVRVDGGGDQQEPGGGADNAAVPESTRRAYSQLLAAHRENQKGAVLSRLSQTNAEIAREEGTIKQAWDSGEFDLGAKLGTSQRRLAELTVQKRDLERHAAQIDAAPPIERDPVQDFLTTRTPEAQAWLRSHPAEARALALQAAGLAGAEESRRAAKLEAAHMSAIGDGLAVDSPEYFSAVSKFIGTGNSNRGTAAEGRNVHYVESRSTDPHSHLTDNGRAIYLTAGEAARARDGSIVWNEADYRAGRIKDRSKIGEPIGAYEFGRRKAEMLRQGFYDRT